MYSFFFIVHYAIPVVHNSIPVVCDANLVVQDSGNLRYSGNVHVIDALHEYHSM